MSVSGSSSALDSIYWKLSHFRELLGPGETYQSVIDRGLRDIRQYIDEPYGGVPFSHPMKGPDLWRQEDPKQVGRGNVLCEGRNCKGGTVLASC